MPEVSRPPEYADQAREALRQLAHTTRQIEEPTEIYAVLGDLSNGLASLAQSLHQMGDFHDGPASQLVRVTGDARTGRATSNKLAWELHRAAEVVGQVAAGIDRAHNIEATIAYKVRDVHRLELTSRHADGPGLSL